MRDFLYICTMEKVTIYKFQLKTILEALRITSNIHNCSEGKTCFDRQVRQAYEYSKNALEGNENLQEDEKSGNMRGVEVINTLTGETKNIGQCKNYKKI